MNNPQTGVNAYRQTAIQSTPPEKLVVMLYDGAIRFLHLAKEAFTNGNHEGTNTNLLKAQDIISELMVTLNMDYEISHNLFRLYDYFNHRLIQANIHKNQEPVDEVLGYLTDLRAAWAQAGILAKQASRSGGMEVAG